MKSEIFAHAIRSRKRVRFIYNLDEIILEPYFISKSRNGKKVIYGRPNNTSEVKKFEYDRIYNIKVIDFKKFSPIIPILSA
ncbi:MAG: hypothetical protein QY331_11385 [Melioribacteraceae bacterium]|jgi:hypothetical protein|nr:MAG: hypothetical protein QY331_11385 [Melioribacteraceae bacterium]